MKLSNSVPLLHHEFHVLQDRPNFDQLWADKVSRIFREYTAKGKTVDNMRRRLTWDLWWALKDTTRNEIIVESIPYDEWVGGYPKGVSDEVLNTLLNKVFGEFVRKALEVKHD